MAFRQWCRLNNYTDFCSHSESVLYSSSCFHHSKSYFIRSFCQRASTLYWKGRRVRLADHSIPSARKCVVRPWFPSQCISWFFQSIARGMLKLLLFSQGIQKPKVVRRHQVYSKFPWPFLSWEKTNTQSGVSKRKKLHDKIVKDIHPGEPHNRMTNETENRSSDENKMERKQSMYPWRAEPCIAALFPLLG